MAKDAGGHGSNPRGWGGAQTSRIDRLSNKVKSDQMKHVNRLSKAGDEFAAYWAGSASASVMNHYKAGAYHTIKGGKKR